MGFPSKIDLTRAVAGVKNSGHNRTPSARARNSRYVDARHAIGFFNQAAHLNLFFAQHLGDARAHAPDSAPRAAVGILNVEVAEVVRLGRGGYESLERNRFTQVGRIAVGSKRVLHVINLHPASPHAVVVDVGLHLTHRSSGVVGGVAVVVFSAQVVAHEGTVGSAGQAKGVLVRGTCYQGHDHLGELRRLQRRIGRIKNVHGINGAVKVGDGACKVWTLVGRGNHGIALKVADVGRRVGNLVVRSLERIEFITPGASQSEAAVAVVAHHTLEAAVKSSRNRNHKAARRLRRSRIHRLVARELLGQKAIRNIHFVAIGINDIKTGTVAPKKNDFGDRHVLKVNKRILPLLARYRKVDALGIVQGTNRNNRGGRNRARTQNGHGACAGGLKLGSVVIGRNFTDELNQVPGHEVFYVGQGNKLVLSIGVNAHYLHSSKRTSRALRGGIYDEEEGTVSALNRARRHFRKIARSNYNTHCFDDLTFKTRRVVAGSQLSGRHILQRSDGVVGLGERVKA